MQVYDDSYDRDLARTIHTKAWTWAKLADHATAHLRAANRIAKQQAAKPARNRAPRSKMTRAQRDCHTHLVSAGIDAGLAHMMRTTHDGDLARRVTPTAIRAIRTHVEAAVNDPRWLPILHSQVAALAEDPAPTGSTTTPATGAPSPLILPS